MAMKKAMTGVSLILLVFAATNLPGAASVHNPSVGEAKGESLISFDAPWLVADAPWPAYFVGFGPFGSQRIAAGALAGTAWVKSSNSSEPWTANEHPGIQLPQVFPSQTPNTVAATLYTFGSFTPNLDLLETASQFNATGGTILTLSATGNSIVQEQRNQTIVFESLPKPIISAKFTKGGVRLGGAASIRLPQDDSILQTIIVTFAGQDKYNYPEATSIVLFQSFDEGLTWKFVTILADAADYPHSEEGPNEMDMTILADNSTILAVVRVDGGDGPVTHPYRNYVQLKSVDRGKTWSEPLSMPGFIGCARPRLLRVGQTLLLTGGRLRNDNTSDVILWRDSSGMAEVTPTTWEEFSISYRHNLGVPVRYNSTFEFDAKVNSTTYSPRETNSYTSLIQLDDGRAMVTYDLIKTKEFAASFSMEFDVA